MIWERICNRINLFAKTDSEKDFESSLIPLLLEDGLGWSKDNIDRQVSFKIGSSQLLRPDIIVYRNNKPQFVIEVKKPNHTQNENDVYQLVSYMKQLEVNVGIYIGEKIDVFYKKIGSGSKAEVILTTSFQDRDGGGEKFYKLFNSSNFSSKEIDYYYQNWLNEKAEAGIIENEISFLISKDGSEILELLLKNYFATKRINESISNKIFDEIDIIIKRKNQSTSKSYTQRPAKPSAKLSPSPNNTSSLSIHSNPKEQSFSEIERKDQINNFLNNKLFYIKSKGCNAIGELTPNNKIRIKRGSILRNEVTKSYSDNDKKRRKELIEVHCQFTEKGYEVLEDFPSLSPSSASGMVQGRSSNGLKDWLDKDGITLGTYLK